MKDRDTQYRLAQNNAMACCFSEWVPGGPGCPTSDAPYLVYLNQLIENAKSAGKKLEQLSPNFFGTTEKAFFLTEAQGAKVRGDVFEVLCRVTLWNACIELNKSLPFPVATLTLGDNYDLRRLFTPDDAAKMQSFIDELSATKISLSYSTPDLICLNISEAEQSVQDYFSQPITNLSKNNQDRLQLARRKIEGHVRPEQLVFACGLKTSLRSDRMYQFLFEANAWKYIWRHVFKVKPCPYYTVMSQSFGADPEKLRSLDFSSTGTVTRAIDGVQKISTPADVSQWFKGIVNSLTQSV